MLKNLSNNLIHLCDKFSLSVSLVSLFPEEDWPVDHVEAGEAEREHHQEHRVHKRQLVAVPVTRLGRPGHYL